MDYDVVIVGVRILDKGLIRQGGCAGLSTAIRLKDTAKKNNLDLSVCILEKGENIGSHILSGCLLNTQGLSELIPNWQDVVFLVFGVHSIRNLL